MVTSLVFAEYVHWSVPLYQTSIPVPLIVNRFPAIVRWAVVMPVADLSTQVAVSDFAKDSLSAAERSNCCAVGAAAYSANALAAIMSNMSDDSLFTYV